MSKRANPVRILADLSHSSFAKALLSLALAVALAVGGWRGQPLHVELKYAARFPSRADEAHYRGQQNACRRKQIIMLWMQRCEHNQPPVATWMARTLHAHGNDGDVLTLWSSCAHTVCYGGDVLMLWSSCAQTVCYGGD
jgi:hypothetical protein